MPKKVLRSFSVNMSTTACPRCKVKFDKGLCRILWHDVIECEQCGHIWVALDLREALRFLKPPRKTDVKSEARINQRTKKGNTDLTARPA